MNRGRNWTLADVQEYRAWLDGYIDGLRTANEVRDCADLAIDAIITFAGTKSLHFEITTRVTPRRTISEVNFRSYEEFSRKARSEAGAQNLADRQNTRPVTGGVPQAGDMLIFNWMLSDQLPNIPYWHTFIIIDSDKLWFGNEDASNAPTVPDWVSSQKKRLVQVDGGTQEVGPEYYFQHGDLYEAHPRRWKFLFGVH